MLVWLGVVVERGLWEVGAGVRGSGGGCKHTYQLPHNLFHIMAYEDKK